MWSSFSVQLQFAHVALYTLQNSSVTVNYYCSTKYISTLDITITTDINNKAEIQYGYKITCSNTSLSFSVDQDHCGHELMLCGYSGTFKNGPRKAECLLHCSSISVVCSTTTTVSPTSGINSQLDFKFTEKIVSHQCLRVGSCGS